MPKTCVFCGRSAPEVKITKEHVMRSALRKYVPDVSPRMRWHASMGGPGLEAPFTKDTSLPLGPFDLTANDVCQSCNNGWLNDSVEAPAEAALGNLMQGLPLVINPSIAKNLATWGAKTAAVRSLIDKPPFAVPPEHFHYIREHLLPPPGTSVWLAHAEYLTGAGMRQVRARMKHADALHFVHLTTIYYGSMAMYVCGTTEPDGEQSIGEMVRAISVRDALQLWPKPHSTNWPTAMMPVAVAKSLSKLRVPGLLYARHATEDWPEG